MIAPDPKDKRFADPEWSSNQFFDFVKQAYLLSTNWAEHLVDGAKDLDPHTRQKAEFYIKQVANALSPSNFVLTNPELLRETLVSNAENLARGMHMLAEDIEAGGGDLKIRQSDAAKFEVGRNLAIIARQGDLRKRADAAHPIRAVDAERAEDAAADLPALDQQVLRARSHAGKILHQMVRRPGAHGVRDLLGQSRTSAQATMDFEDYMRQGPLAAIDAIEQATGENKVHAIGYCVGGTLLSITLAYMAAKSDDRIASATLFAAQVDFTHAGDLKVFVDEEQLEALEKRMAERGYLEGQKMANAFNMLRSNDLIWPYVINNYLRGKAPMPFDLLYWNSDATRMPAANHAFYLRQCYLNNALSQGKMTIANVKLDLKQGEGAALQSRHPRGPYRAGEVGVPRLEVLRRAGEVRAVGLGPHRRRRQPARARPSTSTGPAARPARARSKPG